MFAQQHLGQVSWRELGFRVQGLSVFRTIPKIKNSLPKLLKAVRPDVVRPRRDMAGLFFG